MLAGVLREAGAPEAIQLERVPIPTPKPGQVLLRVKAFGINRSELLTRMGVMLLGVSVRSLITSVRLSRTPDYHWHSLF